MGTHQPIRKIVTPEIPDKLYFRIGDVAKLCDVATYVLRFWETEFSQLKPNKGGTGQRLYRKKDVETALRIKTLLYDQGYTIPGARAVLKTEPKSTDAKAQTTEPQPTATRILHSAPQPVAMPQPQADTAPFEDAGSAMRRRAKLESLRKEMAALLTSLEGAPGTSAAPPSAAAKSKVQTMRPRLAVEPALFAPRPKLADVKSEDDRQRDLF